MDQTQRAHRASFIGKFNTFLLRRFVADHEDVDNPDVRAAYGYLEGVIGTILEVFLFISKLVIGFSVGSIALIAEAFHSLSDIFSSLIVIIGFRVAKQPPDVRHPYGHGRFEAIATLVTAIVLVVLSIEIATTSIERLISPTPVTVSWLAVGILFVTVAIKEFMARVAIDLGRRIDARILVADSVNQRVDSLAAAVVLAGFAGVALGFDRFDAIAGLGVVGFILYSAYDIARDSLSFLLGQGPDEDTIELIRLIARSVDGVKGAHAIMVHDYGVRKAITLHILVDKNLTVEQAHLIASGVEEKIEATVAGASVDVHVGPMRPLKEANARHLLQRLR